MRKLFKTMMMLLVLIPFLALPVIGFAEEYTTGEEVKKEKKKTVELEGYQLKAGHFLLDVPLRNRKLQIIF